MFKKKDYIFIVVWVLLIAVYIGLVATGTNENIKGLFSNISQNILALAAAIFAFFAAMAQVKGSYRRLVWLCFSLGMAFWAAANVSWTIYFVTVGDDPSDSSWINYLFIPMYLFFIIGYIIFFERSSVSIPYFAMVIAALIISGGVYLNAYLEMFDSVQTQDFIINSLFGILSPVVFGMLVLIAITIIFNRGSSPAWWYLIVGMALFYSAEISDSVLSEGDYGYREVLWPLSLGFISIAAIVSYNFRSAKK